MRTRDVPSSYPLRLLLGAVFLVVLVVWLGREASHPEPLPSVRRGARDAADEPLVAPSAPGLHGARTSSPAPAPAAPNPPDPDPPAERARPEVAAVATERALALEVRVVEAANGRRLKAPWGLGPSPPEGKPATFRPTQTVPLPEGERLARHFWVMPPPKFVAWDPARIDVTVARRATALLHVFPLRAEASARVRVTHEDDRTAGDVSLSAWVAGVAVEPRWDGTRPAGEVRGLPFLQEEEVVFEARQVEASAGGEYVRVARWEGRFGRVARDALEVRLVLPAEGEWRTSEVTGESLTGVGGGAGGEFRGRRSPRAPDELGRVEVRLLDREGRPLARSAVRLAGVMARTDGDGVAVFPAVRAGEHEVETHEPGVVATRTTVTVVPAGSTRATLHEAQGGTLDVEVVDGEGDGLPFASVTFGTPFDAGRCDLSEDGVQRTDPFTDARGRRQYLHVSAGPLRVTARFGRRVAEQEIEVVDGRRTTVRLVLPSATGESPK